MRIKGIGGSLHRSQGQNMHPISVQASMALAMASRLCYKPVSLWAATKAKLTNNVPLSYRGALLRAGMSARALISQSGLIHCEIRKDKSFTRRKTRGGRGQTGASQARCKDRIARNAANESPDTRQRATRTNDSHATESGRGDAQVRNASARSDWRRMHHHEFRNNFLCSVNSSRGPLNKCSAQKCNIGVCQRQDRN